MKSIAAISCLFLALTVGFVITQQRDADAYKVTKSQVTAPTGQATALQITEPRFEPKKKCSFSSDCRYGKCKKGRCGGCSFQSDCKGWGKCKNGWCGACSFQSDCKGWGSCRSGRCTKSPY